MYLIIIHTWPVFNSTSNAMRTGLAMSSMFLSLCALHKNKYFKSFFFIIMTTFLHFKTGPILILTYLVTIFIKLIFNNQFFKKYKILFVIICLLNSFLIFVLVSLTDNWLEYSHRIIGYDFSIPFFFINIFLIFFFTYKLNYILKNYLFIFIYFYLFIPLSLFFHGLPTQYERLHMMMLILYILSLGVLFKKRQTEFFWLISFSLLMLMTYLTGMYSMLR